MSPVSGKRCHRWQHEIIIIINIILIIITIIILIIVFVINLHSQLCYLEHNDGHLSPLDALGS